MQALPVHFADADWDAPAAPTDPRRGRRHHTAEPCYGVRADGERQSVASTSDDAAGCPVSAIYTWLRRLEEAEEVGK